ncbi:hypothetical protein Taro_007674, partial [Colocasia esculenta]|nr:hypothetical protein [Colocasia esculenta]
LCYAKHQESILPRLTSMLGRSSPEPDMALIAQALDQVVSTQCFKCKAKQSSSVDTGSGSVDTRDSSQNTFWPSWDSVSTLVQVVSTLEAFPEHLLG